MKGTKPPIPNKAIEMSNVLDSPILLLIFSARRLPTKPQTAKPYAKKAN